MRGWDLDIKSNINPYLGDILISDCISYDSVSFRISGGILAAKQRFYPYYPYKYHPMKHPF